MSLDKSNIIPTKVTGLVALGSLIIAAALTLLLVFYDIFVFGTFKPRIISALAVITYLIITNIFVYYRHIRIAQWMIILIYEALALAILLNWGINSPIGVLAVSFVIILPSLLMGARYIFPVGFLTFAMIMSVQIINSNVIVQTDNEVVRFDASQWDLLAYLSILTVFGFVSWLSGNLIEQSFKRARRAESALRDQKDILRSELERESAALRQSQLDQIQQLHKFALIGQSTAATLHELSNHLSVLNLDIDDLKQHRNNSKAIENAKLGVEYINKTVRIARQQLNSYDQSVNFSIYSTLNQVVKDFNEKFTHSGVELIWRQPTPEAKKLRAVGDPLALMQVVTILLNNALDACCTSKHPCVELLLSKKRSVAIISVIDNGPGVDPKMRADLFTPHPSTKPLGLGIGLYIAQRLSKSLFNGKIELVDSESGAHFNLKIPSKPQRNKKSPLEPRARAQT